MLNHTMPPTQASASTRLAFFARTTPSILVLLLVLPHPTHAHPLKAAPLNHPHVYTFDQFFLPEDDDAFLTQGGLLLLAELNCAACHSVPAAWLPLIGPLPGPDLRHVGSRLDLDALWRFIRSPQHRKPGTHMPGLFAGNEEPDPDTIEALATYLSTLTTNLSVPEPGDPERGKNLYHTVGCVACHEPATDYRPASLPPDADLEAPSLASAPIALADDYSYPALTAFLVDPLSMRPASRMPAQHLSPAEAADIAAYLHTGQIPARFMERQILNLTPQPPARGRQLFSQHRCTACHETGEKLNPAPTAKTLPQLSPTAATGCLSGQIHTGIPRYDLTPLQTRALRLALLQIQTQPTPSLTAPESLSHHLARLNCYACHDHDGRGGPEIARAPYFTTTLRLLPNDDLQNLPPSLDGVARRLNLKALTRRLTQPDPSPPSTTRMPRFTPQSLAPLIPLLNAR
jgi:mono/diheme cytochrome c family protein